MMQAVYFCSGSLSTKDFWHYGLATDYYTHFTSPIRRYADVIVHRLLGAILQGRGAPWEGCTKKYVDDLTDNLNHRHRMAQLAGRSSVDLYTYLYFKGRVALEDAYVTRVLKNGLVILIPK
jgi:exosome complex exonuclease DIS3/RRP44